MGRNLATLAGLAALTLLVFGRTVGFEFLVADDDVYVVQNARVLRGLSWENLRWALTTLEADFWHPLTWLSLMLDAELFGLDPAGFHATNVLLHTGSTLLLFVTLSRMSGAPYRSACVAALFAVHPLHVESVAWVAERKDVLSVFFGMLTLACYGEYVRRQSRGWYAGLLIAFFLSLAAKPTLVALSRVDACPDPEAARAALREAGADPVLPLSSVSGTGVRAVLDALDALVARARETGQEEARGPRRR